MTSKEAADLLDLIENHAPRLRDAGVRGIVQLGDVRFSIGEASADGTATAEEEEADDPLNDPATYGLRSSAPIPGSRRSKTS
jgi:hypothetical protein